MMFVLNTTQILFFWNKGAGRRHSVSNSMQEWRPKFDFQHLLKKLSVSEYAHNPSTAEVERGILEFTGQIGSPNESQTQWDTLSQEIM